MRIDVRSREKGRVTGRILSKYRRPDKALCKDILPVRVPACTQTLELSKIEVFPNMSQCPVQAFYPGVLAGHTLFMEQAFECTGFGVPEYEVAKDLVGGWHNATEDRSTLVP
jgi:hypothetical protein